MENSVNYFLLLLLLLQFLSCGSSRRMKEAPTHVNYAKTIRQEMIKSSESKKDITTPITTIPNLFPTITTPTIPTTTSPTPILNPNSNPDTLFSPPISSTFPITTSNSTTIVPNSGSSWCIASPSASLRALQVALDYACGYGGTDCSGIQPGGNCYYPNSVRDHANYAFNKYYQKNPVPNSCNFGGTALITSTNPSVGTCQYPSTSTSSSILNTTNTVGANVFGAVPVPTNPTASDASATLNSYAEICLIISWAILMLENTIMSLIT